MNISCKNAFGYGVFHARRLVYLAEILKSTEVQRKAPDNVDLTKNSEGRKILRDKVIAKISDLEARMAEEPNSKLEKKITLLRLALKESQDAEVAQANTFNEDGHLYDRVQSAYKLSQRLIAVEKTSSSTSSSLGVDLAKVSGTSMFVTSAPKGKHIDDGTADVIKASLDRISGNAPGKPLPVTKETPKTPSILDRLSGIEATSAAAAQKKALKEAQAQSDKSSDKKST